MQLPNDRSSSLPGVPYTPYRRATIWDRLVSILFYYILLCLFVWFIQNFLVGTNRVVSESMNPALVKGDSVLVTPLVVGSRLDLPFGPLTIGGFGKPKRGDIVLLDAPFARRNLPVWVRLANSVSSFLTLGSVHILDDGLDSQYKPIPVRVVGLPGEVVTLSKSVLYIRSSTAHQGVSELDLNRGAYEILVDSLPAGWQETDPLSGEMNELLLGGDEYFVLHDNRSFALDSRSFGIVSRSRFRGSVFLRYWPFSRFGKP